MARLNVWSIVLVVLALSGCAGFLKPVQPEKLVLDWKDFSPAAFESNCNQWVALSTAQKHRLNSWKRLCYQSPPLSSLDQYSLVVDIYSFDDDQQYYFDRIYSDITEIDKPYERTFFSNLAVKVEKMDMTVAEERGYNAMVDLLEKRGLSTVSHNCSNDLQAVSDNALFCSDPDKNLMFAVKYLLHSGKIADLKLYVWLDARPKINESGSEYKTAMRILNDKNLLSLVD
ncbi:hypothetical protein [Endozoicomonas sp.]|uniref:hypothetical protein n=1 Tax=Endozoicomonas sp. TaxID=1892382 RepID=UPI00383BEE7F